MLQTHKNCVIVDERDEPDAFVDSNKQKMTLAERAEEYLLQGKNVIVTACLINKHEVQPYFDLHKKYNIRFEIRDEHSNYKNLRKVPHKTVEQMKKDFYNFNKTIFLPKK